MVKMSVFLEDMALLDSIDIEEEIIDNIIYLRLSTRKSRCRYVKTNIFA